MRTCAVAVLVGVLLLSGCSGIEPWVKPYERDRLADPVMSFDRDPVSTSYLDHVHEARGGARPRAVLPAAPVAGAGATRCAGVPASC
jgi:hypothetical protein